MTAATMAYANFWFHSDPWTEEDFLALPPGGPKIELVEGKLIASPAPRRAHQRLMRRLANSLEENAPAQLGVDVELNIRVGPGKILIPDVVATYEQGDDVCVHDPEHVLLVAEVLSPSNHGERWVHKNHLYARAGIPWCLIVETDDESRPSLLLQRLEKGVYVSVAKAECGQSLRLPEPLGEIDPAVLLRR